MDRTKVLATDFSFHKAKWRQWLRINISTAEQLVGHSSYMKVIRVI